MVAPTTADRRTVMRLTGTPGLAAFGGVAPTRGEREGFRLTAAISRFSALAVTHTRHTAVTTLRAGDNFGWPHRAIRLLIVLEGRITLRAPDRSVRLGVGGGALLHGWAEYLYESEGTVASVHLDVGVEDAPFAGSLRHVPAMQWPEGYPVLSAAGAALYEIVRRDEGGITTATRNAMERLAQSTLLSVLASPLESSASEPESEIGRARVLEHIATRHTDPDLTPAVIAADLGMSMRSLQRLFTDTGMGVAGHIAAARLEHALALLSDPLLTRLSLARIAARSGFGSSARMARVVSKATGLRPAELRHQHTSHGP
ncbi:helix-turn-helix transcriptional regulator [Xylanimonas ulmi]|uniref:Helix-turn-helix protein n=1 Tax=Xylanimonas ulmi TaxID=228973 RepID=A0A4Q7LZC0_9MICO|nr:helix-turn-helix transcriptional regulator [Xylanibacterium ulmi]RZS60745.1 helix-turn-helix protein [Xylanibacterium ulmi]